MKTTYIYAIRDLEIDKLIYVGKSNNPQGRFRGHVGNSSNGGIQEFVEEKGKDCFCLEVLEIVEFEVSEDWVEREKFWIKKFREEGHPLCNKNDGGGGVTEHTEKYRHKLSERMSGENNPFYGKDMSGKNNPMYGRYHTEEVKREQSRRMSGKNHPQYGLTGEDHPNYGKRRSKGDIAKRSGENHPMYGKKRPDHSERLSGEGNPMYGKHHTEETKAKMGPKISKANMGHEVTEETRLKIREARSKPYSAFYNVKTNAVIPAGIGLRQVCIQYNLNYGAMGSLNRGKSIQSKDGWRIVAII